MRLVFGYVRRHRVCHWYPARHGRVRRVKAPDRRLRGAKSLSWSAFVVSCQGIFRAPDILMSELRTRLAVGQARNLFIHLPSILPWKHHQPILRAHLAEAAWHGRV